MQSYSNNVQDTKGNAYTAASVLVKTAAGVVATIYSDDGVTTQANPISPDSTTGQFSFYAADGDYTLTITGAGPVSITQVKLFDNEASSGAASVGFIQAGTGAVARTVEAKARDAFHVKDFDILADGSDETTKLQAALTAAAGHALTIEGEITTGPVNVPSNSILYFVPGSRLKAKTGLGLNDKLVNIDGVSNVVIYGNNGEVQMLKAEYLTGEQRHCVNITSGATNVVIYDLIAKDSGGDGFYVGGTTACNNVHIINCTGDNNRRQGLSIVNVIGCTVIGGEYKNTIGAGAPECGIDIESNIGNGYYLQNVLIEGVRTYNNNGGGILVAPNSKFAPVSITVRDCTSEYDGERGGIALNAAMAHTGATDPAIVGKINGIISIDNITIIEPQGRGIGSINWTENAPETRIGTVTVIDPCSNAALDTNDIHRCAMLIRSEVPSSGEFGTSVGYLSIDNLIAVDTRAVKKMAIPLYLNMEDEAVKPLKEFTVGNIDAVKTDWTNALLVPVLRSGSLAITNVRIGYKVPWAVEVGSMTVSAPYIGATLVPAVSSTYTLPTAANFVGSSFNFRSDNSGTNLVINPQAGDVISNYAPSAGIGIISRVPGAMITLMAVESGRWQVTEETGGWGAATYYGERYRVSSNTAAPVAGTWEVGDRLFHKTPTLGGFAGWVCTAAGTPGTWTPFGATLGVSADKGNAPATLAVTSEPTSVWNTPLTADRAVTLSTTSAFNGAKLRIVRTAAATGAFNLNVGTGPLKALAVGTWCDVEYNGTAWALTAYGAL